MAKWTEEEEAANRLTHNFVDTSGEGDMECTDCCSKPWHVAARWPCGQEPPREVVDAESIVPLLMGLTREQRVALDPFYGVNGKDEA